MSDPEEPKQQPTPAKTPKKPQAPEQEDSDQSMEDPGYQSGRSRSQSRRRRRQNQRQRAQQQQQPQDGGSGGGAQAQTMAKIEEEQNAMPELEEDDVMQPFERIGPPSKSMDGPVTYARAMRGEIPMRGGDPRKAQTGQNTEPDAQAGGKSIMDEEGLKLRLELNLDIEIELKASIHGDLTLALL